MEPVTTLDLPKLLDQLHERVSIVITVYSQKMRMSCREAIIYFQGKDHPTKIGTPLIDAFLTSLRRSAGVGSGRASEGRKDGLHGGCLGCYRRSSGRLQCRANARRWPITPLPPHTSVSYRGGQGD